MSVRSRALAAGSLPVLGSVLLGASASAQPSIALIDNLAEPTKAATVMLVSPTEAIWAAQSFSADAQRYTLDGITTNFGMLVDSPTIFFELRVGEDPTGPVLATFAVPPLSPTMTEEITLTPDTPVRLEGGQLYWIVTGVLDEGSYEWPYALGQGFVGPGAFGNYWYSFDLGATWSNFGEVDPYKIRVDVTEVRCLANCTGDRDAISGAPILDIQDFSCFQNAFALGDLSTADVGGVSGCEPDGELDILDFSCFQNLFALGCP